MALRAFEVSLAFKTPLEELGVSLEGTLEKKLWIDRCPGCVPELELCFFREGGGFAGVAFTSSLSFAIFTGSSSIRNTNARVGKANGRRFDVGENCRKKKR
jgi:hypothetical protein